MNTRLAGSAPAMDQEAEPLGKVTELWRAAPDGRLTCTACARYCTLREGQTGLCGVRANVAGEGRLLVYGRIITGHVDPIEKKPVQHYMPGTRIFSVATTGCNWLCQYCQNHDISQRRRVEGRALAPEEVADLAVESGSQGIAYTYNQPSIFLEYARDIGLAARTRGLFNVFVSNGYDTPGGVAEMQRFLDCITVDFKGSAEPGFTRKYVGIPDPEPIFETLERLRRTRIHVEITDLVVPQVGDREDAARRLCRRIHDIFGPLMPIHFLRFHPDYRMMDLPSTPIATLERHVAIAREEGLLYAYVGNAHGHPLEDTRCHGCRRVVVDRHGYELRSWDLETRGTQNFCRSCGTQVPITGPLHPGHRGDRSFGVV